MLTVPQIESLRTSNPQLYEALKRLAEASLGPNQGWSLDDQITDGSLFARVTSGALTSGKVDPAKSGVLMKGSVPPTWSGAFTYVSTTTTITWSWTGPYHFARRRHHDRDPQWLARDQRTHRRHHLLFYPYYDDAALAIGWVAGGASSAGSPANAFTAKTNSAAQQQALQSRIPLSQGAVVAATTSSGTGGGSGGGSGSCVRAGTMVLTKERGTVAIETCAVGEHLRCPSILRADATTAATSASSNAAAAMGGTAEGWTRIIRHEVRDADTFIRLHFSNAETLDVTPHHIFTLADGSPMRAERLCLSDILVGRYGRVTLLRIETIIEAGQKVTISCAPYQQFFAGRHAASVLTHNYTFSS